MTSSVVVWRGPSEIDGQPIVAIVTNLLLPSKNKKTGNMAQLYILRDDMNPSEAVRSGGDKSICGTCSLRSGSNIGRACYVIWWQAPMNVYRHRHLIDTLTPKQVAGAEKCATAIRLAAYGDPAAVPPWVILDLLSGFKNWTGYTHSWRECDQQLADYLMASVESEEDAQEAHALGWRTFRIGMAPVAGAECRCPASDEMGHRTTCEKCQLCRGWNTPARSVVIQPHGNRTKFLRVL